MCIRPEWFPENLPYPWRGRMGVYTSYRAPCWNEFYWRLAFVANQKAEIDGQPIRAREEYVYETVMQYFSERDVQQLLQMLQNNGRYQSMCAELRRAQYDMLFSTFYE